MASSSLCFLSLFVCVLPLIHHARCSLCASFLTSSLLLIGLAFPSPPFRSCDVQPFSHTKYEGVLFFFSCPFGTCSSLSLLEPSCHLQAWGHGSQPLLAHNGSSQSPAARPGPGANMPQRGSLATQRECEPGNQTLAELPQTCCGVWSKSLDLCLALPPPTEEVRMAFQRMLEEWPMRGECLSNQPGKSLASF